MQEIPSSHGKQITGHPAEKAGNGRRRRLVIRQTKSGNQESGFESRKFAFKKVASPEAPAPEAMKAAKLKDVFANMSSATSLSSLSQLRFPSHSCSSLRDSQIQEKGQGGSEESSERVATLRSDSASMIGRRRAMEDAVTVAPEMVAGKYAFFAVYDGHGGDRVANACREKLHNLVENQLQAISEKPSGDEPSTSCYTIGNVNWEKVLAACFSRMDDEVLLNDRRRIEAGEAEEAVGSTALVVMVGEEQVVVANCGDSRAVLCRGGVVMPLSNDHKPERPDERKRVEAAGGKVIDWNGCRVQGVLSTSRSIGDHYLRPYVISEPEVTVNRITELDEFLIIATDGLWDVVSNEFACEVVRRCLDGRIRRKYSSKLSTDAAAILAELAVAKGSKDNISVIVVELKARTEMDSHLV